jgi:hypothetical protein
MTTPPCLLLEATARALLARTARAQRSSRSLAHRGRRPRRRAAVVGGRGAVQEPHADVQHRLGSISKTVTAVAVLRLRDEGVLDLDDPLERHVPGRRSARARSASCCRTRRPALGEPGQWWERVPGQPWDAFAEQLGADDLPHAAGAGSTTRTSATACSASCSRAPGDGRGPDVVRDEVLLPLG